MPVARVEHHADVDLALLDHFDLDHVAELGVVGDRAHRAGVGFLDRLKSAARLGFGDYAVIEQVFTLPRPTRADALGGAAASLPLPLELCGASATIELLLRFRRSPRSQLRLHLC
jgi:hypothetical protein